MREGEILSLERNPVDLLANTINLQLGETKNDLPRTIFRAYRRSAYCWSNDADGASLAVDSFDQRGMLLKIRGSEGLA